MVYVDPLFKMIGRNPQAIRAGARHDHLWCHLWADSLSELVAFGAKLRLKKEWIQKGRTIAHFDLVPTKRTEAISLGAKEIPFKDWFVKRQILHQAIREVLEKLSSGQLEKMYASISYPQTITNPQRKARPCSARTSIDKKKSA